jgi:hypothetical protein
MLLRVTGSLATPATDTPGHINQYTQAVRIFFNLMGRPGPWAQQHGCDGTGQAALQNGPSGFFLRHFNLLWFSLRSTHVPAFLPGR